MILGSSSSSFIQALPQLINCGTKLVAELMLSSLLLRRFKSARTPDYCTNLCLQADSAEGLKMATCTDEAAQLLDGNELSLLFNQAYQLQRGLNVPVLGRQQQTWHRTQLSHWQMEFTGPASTLCSWTWTAETVPGCGRSDSAKKLPESRYLVRPVCARRPTSSAHQSPTRIELSFSIQSKVYGTCLQWARCDNTQDAAQCHSQFMGPCDGGSNQLFYLRPSDVPPDTFAPYSGQKFKMYTKHTEMEVQQYISSGFRGWSLEFKDGKQLRSTYGADYYFWAKSNEELAFYSDTSNEAPAAGEWNVLALPASQIFS